MPPELLPTTIQSRAAREEFVRLYQETEDTTRAVTEFRLAFLRALRQGVEESKVKALDSYDQLPTQTVGQKKIQLHLKVPCQDGSCFSLDTGPLRGTFEGRSEEITPENFLRIPFYFHYQTADDKQVTLVVSEERASIGSFPVDGHELTVFQNCLLEIESFLAGPRT